MRIIDAPGLLQAWEDASGRALPEQALRLVAAASAETASMDDFARWSVRRRDAALFDLRLALFGRVAEGLVPCPACAEPLEMQFDLLPLTPTPQSDEDAARGLVVGDVAVTWRLPDTDDLLAIARESDEGRARTQLLERCVSATTRDGVNLDLGTLEADVLEQVAVALARDHADLTPTFVVECPACGHIGEAPFAIDAFLWREVDAWARRTLHEVDALARAYGWTEHDVLSLSPTRRRLYLELAARA